MAKNKQNAAELNEYINRLFHVLSSAQKSLAKLPAKYNFQDFKAIYYIGHNPGIMQRKVANHLMLTPGSASIIISKLVKNKLVQKERLTTNQRAVQLHLTTAGEKIYYKMLEMHLQFCSQILKKLDIKEQKVFLSLFKKITS